MTGETTIQSHDAQAVAYTATDPLRNAQWHINYMNLPSVWADYTGVGVKVMIVDDGFDLTHPDLAGQFNAQSYDYLDDDAIAQAILGNNHGTAVAGLIGAANNTVGGVGVAFDAELIAARIGFGGAYQLNDFENAFFAMRDVDVANNSWGYSQAFSDNFLNTSLGNLPLYMQQAAALGTSIVFSSGNYAFSSDNTNYHNLINSPYAITISGFNQDETILNYATQGANILVSAPGSGLITTDLVGTGGYGNTDYVTAEGTSFAAPNVSGVIALMKEANPDLGYRDVQEILVRSAHLLGPNTSWQTNGAGLHYSPAYGFGAVDAHAAVRLAETWQGIQNFDNIAHDIGSLVLHATIPENATLASSITIAGDMLVEHVKIHVVVDHANASHLEFTLVSPSGTRSVLADNAPHTGAMPVWDFYTVANWGEHAAGSWTLEIRDTITGTTGLLNEWTLDIIGPEPTTDNVFIYTNEFINLISPIDTDGGIDTLNASARTGNLTIDLPANIENVFTGDGNDYVIGNAWTNRINTGRGNDTIIASIGADDIDGGKGDDTYYSYDAFAHAVTVNGPNNVTLTAQGITTHIKNVEHFKFAGIDYSLADIIAASQTTDPIDVVYAVTGDNGIKIRTSTDSGFHAYDASELNIGGTGVVLLEEREFDQLTLTNNAGEAIDRLTMRMDDGLTLTARGFSEVNLVADGEHNTQITIGGAQRGFIQTGAGDDTVFFVAFLIDQNAPAQDRTLTANTFGGNDTIRIDDRTHYLVYDIDMGEGDDVFFAKGSLGGVVDGGSGSDTFKFGLNNGTTTINDFNELQDHVDLSLLLEHHADPLATYISLLNDSGNTHISVDGQQIATLRGTSLTDTVQHYIDNGLIIAD